MFHHGQSIQGSHHETLLGGWGGGGGVAGPFAWQFLFYFIKETGNLIFFTAGYAGNNYLDIYIIFISTSFVDKIFISTMPCGQDLFHPFHPQF